MKRFLPILLLLISGILSACVAPQSKPVPKAEAKPTPVRKTFWNAEGAKGPAKIVVGLSEQRAYFYKADHLVGECPISSGRKGFETPAGDYRVIQKDEKHVSNLYGDFVDAEGKIVKKSVDMSKEQPPEGATFVGAPMPYFMRFAKGYGLHSGRLPGRRASHGCVRMPSEMARHFFEHAEVGTPVIVTETPVPVEP